MKKFLTFAAFLAVFATSFAHAEGRLGVQTSLQTLTAGRSAQLTPTIGVAYFDDGYAVGLGASYMSNSGASTTNSLAVGLNLELRSRLTSDIMFGYGIQGNYFNDKLSTAQWNVGLALNFETEIADSLLASFTLIPVSWTTGVTNGVKTDTISVGGAGAGVTYFFN